MSLTADPLSGFSPTHHPRGIVRGVRPDFGARGPRRSFRFGCIPHTGGATRGVLSRATQPRPRAHRTSPISSY
eukprot:4845072-Pleurochrysis_carterae.AAC.1